MGKETRDESLRTSAWEAISDMIPDEFVVLMTSGKFKQFKTSGIFLQLANSAM